jgi:hypothetical protein
VVFQGEQKRMRRLLVLPQVKAPTIYDGEALKKARTEKAVAEQAKLVASLRGA